MVSPVLVGREAERATLRDAIERARAGSPSTVLIGGEAGVGKTRLIRDFSEQTVDERAGDARVLIGGCLELGTDGLPFAPFTAVLRGLVRDLGANGIAALLPGGETRALARLLPEFGEPGPDGEDARARLFEQVLALLERLSEDAPIALIIEDAHWADRSTRDLLSFLIRYQRHGTRLLIVVTYRSDELHRRHPLRPLLAELGRVAWVTRMELARLTRREVVELAGGILGREPADIDAIYARSEGNPLYVEALLQSDGADLPDSLRDLLLAGVERLPEESQELLRVASAGGVRIEHGLLAAVAGSPHEPAGQPRESAGHPHGPTGNLDEAALRAAVAGNILVVDGEGYAFRHALIREAIHDDLLPGERTRLHTRYAEAIEANPGLLPAPRNAIELAHHWHAAHDTTWAMISAWRAASAARKSLAHDEQLRMLTRVLELWDRVPDAVERIEADHIEVLRHAAAVAFPAGEFERGLAFADAALSEIDEDAEPIRAARILRLCGMFRYDLGRPGYIEDLRTAVRLVPEEPPSVLRARMLESLSRAHNEGAREEKIATAKEAMALAHRVGDGATEAHALVTLTWAQFRFSEVDDGIGGFAEARRIAADARAHNAIMRAAISESDVLEGAGWHEEAVRITRRDIAQAREYGLARASGAFLAINLTEPLVSLGRWDEALEVIERVLEMAPPAPYQASLRGFATDVAIARGELDRAESLLQSSRAVLGSGKHRDQSVLPHRRREIELESARGNDDRARELLESALQERDLAISPRYSWPLLVAGARIARAPIPDLVSAAEAVDTDGLVQRAHRLTFAAMVNGDAPAWEEAAAAWNALRQPYAEAQALVGAGLGGGDRDAATRRLTRALELADGLRAVPLRDEIASLARRARLPVGEAPSAEPALGGLTARELEVFRLVAAGRSNREIAEELFIAVKTVSVHVSNILAKLGVGSRGEAAAEAHRRGLFTPR